MLLYLVKAVATHFMVINVTFHHMYVFKTHVDLTLTLLHLTTFVRINKS